MRYHQPKISVFVSTRNRIESLKKTLQSIENQGFKDFELIIVNDASTDGTLEFLFEYAQANDFVKIFNNVNKMGLAYNRNVGINTAIGKYFTFVDDDDCLLENALEKYYEKAQDVSDDSPFFLIGGYRKKSGSKFFDYIHNFNGSLKDAFICGLTPPVASQFYPLEMLKLIEGYNENVKSGVDHDLWIRLIKFNPLIFSTEVATSEPNCSYGLNNRMTFDIKKRIKEIQLNFETWETNLRMISDSFFLHFKNSYNYYLSIVIKKNKFTILNNEFVSSPKTSFISHRIQFNLFGLKRLIDKIIFFKSRYLIFKIRVYSFPKFKNK